MKTTSLIKVSIILLFLFWAFCYSLSNAINIPTFHLDGAFQTASSLFRLDAGQFPGKDFFPYLGIGPIIILYPVFKILGANLAASVFSAHFMVLVFNWLAVSILWHLCFCQKSLISSLAIGSFFFFLLYSLDISSSFFCSPGNSLRPIRAAIPYLIIIIYYCLILNIKHEFLRYILSGITTGMSLLWSNDFAIPCAVLFVILVTCASFVRKELILRNIFLYFSFAILSFSISLYLATHGHPLNFLAYNFLDVAKDQWWFFGPYSESSRIFEFNQITKLIFEIQIFPLIIFLAITIIAIFRKKIEYVCLVWIGLVLLTGGALASIGGHLGSYFDCFHSWALITLFFSFLKVIFFLSKKIVSSYNIYKTTILLIIFLVLLRAAVLSYCQYKSNLENIKKDYNYFYVTELGGYLRKDWKDYIELIRATSTQHITEEYWGLWSAVRHTFSPGWPIDSVIHALGHTRLIAKEALKDSEIIVSTRNSTAPEWQPWSLSENFWFYDELLTKWVPQELSPTTIVWHKSKTPQLFQPIKCQIDNGKKSITLTIPEEGFYRIKISYYFSGKGRYLLLAKNNLSFAARAEGYVSINPQEKHVSLPAYFSQKGPTTLDFKVVGNKEYIFKIISCSADYIPFINDEILHIPGKDQVL